MKTDAHIKRVAREIENTCSMEYPEAGEEAVYQMAADRRHLGWSQDEIELLLRELGF
jgi:hypothetical protein